MEYYLLFILIGFLIIYYFYQNFKEGMENENEDELTNSENTYDNYNHYEQSSNPIFYYSPNGEAYMKVLSNTDEKTIMLVYKNDVSIPFYYDDNDDIYKGPNNSTIILYQDDSGNYLAEIKNGDSKEITVFTTVKPQNTKIKDYSDEKMMANPIKIEGILGSEIIPENKDLYILKTQIIPPVCNQPKIDYTSFRKRNEYRKKKNEYNKMNEMPNPIPYSIYTTAGN